MTVGLWLFLLLLSPLWWRNWWWEKQFALVGRVLLNKALIQLFPGLYHWLNGHEFEQTLGDSEGEGRLECCSPWSCKESDMTEQYLTVASLIWMWGIFFCGFQNLPVNDWSTASCNFGALAGGEWGNPSILPSRTRSSLQVTHDNIII